jgi:signal transduction histidine kinase/ActR/RegA family two-component response regulator
VTTGEALDVEFRIIRPDRSVRWIASQGRLHAESGQPRRMVGVAFDITERKQAEQTAQFLADASEALASLVDLKSTLEKVAKLAVPFFAEWCLVDLLDVDGILRRMAIAHGDPSQEESARTIFQRWPFSPGSEEGPRHVLRTGCSHLVSALTDDMLTRGVQEPALVARIRALGLRSYIGVPLTVRGKPLGVLTFLAAESGRRYGANDLAAAEDLAHRAAIAVENSQLYHALRESDRRKDEFLAMLAHELRNPLAPIASALEIMKAPSADAAAQFAARDVAERQLAHLRRLVDDLLDVSRIMRGKIELRKEPIQLATIVARAVESVQPLIDAAGHELTVKLPPDPSWLDVDPVRISQVISNLLTNAAKYTEPHGQIHIAALRDGDRVVIRVRDTGIGIAADVLPYLFEMFMQVAPGASRSQGGLGIGLTLVKNLVEMHGGTITALSDGPGQGSEFVITLPAMLTAPAAEVPPVALSPRFAAGRHVLVVDDNVDAAQSLTILLRLHGHRVRIVHGGEQALTAVAAEKPDLVLLDIGMPGMNGFEVARRLRERHGSGDLTLVALTGWGQEQDRLRSKEAGFDHHLTKPVELTTLQAVLESCAAAGTAQLQ